MSLPLALLRTLETADAVEAWQSVLAYAWQIFAPSLPAVSPASEIMRREREIHPVDLFLSSAAYDLWSCCQSKAPLNTNEILTWWSSRPPGRAVLILDGFSAREASWIVHSAAAHGCVVHQARLNLAELPPDTTPFARSLGFGQRSALNHGVAPSGSPFAGASTDSTDMPWQDVAKQVPTTNDVFIWHEWPDARLHELSGKGGALEALAKEAAEQLTGDDFWLLIDRLTQGRRLLITSDHGYAVTSQFANTEDEDQAKYLQQNFASGRSTGDGETGSWVPPLALRIEGKTGIHRMVLGRRKWRSPGGYPTLTHGGLSLLEVAVPFLEIERN